MNIAVPLSYTTHVSFSQQLVVSITWNSESPSRVVTFVKVLYIFII